MEGIYRGLRRVEFPSCPRWNLKITTLGKFWFIRREKEYIKERKPKCFLALRSNIFYILFICIFCILLFIFLIFYFKFIYLFIYFVLIYKGGPKRCTRNTREEGRTIWSHVHQVTKTQFENIAWCRLCGVEWLKSLTNDFEHVATLWIRNFNRTMREDSLHNIWSWPPGF